MTIIRYTDDNTEGYSAADLATLNAEFDRACMELDIDPDAADKSMLDAVAERILAAYDARDEPGERWHIFTAYNTAPIVAWGTPEEAERYVEILNADRIVNVYAAHKMTPGAVVALEMSARKDDGLNLSDELTDREGL